MDGALGLVFVNRIVYVVGLAIPDGIRRHKQMMDDMYKADLNDTSIDAPGDKLNVINSRLIMGSKDFVVIESKVPLPNIWRRFWYWVLLGWTWEKP